MFSCCMHVLQDVRGGRWTWWLRRIVWDWDGTRMENFEIVEIFRNHLLVRLNSEDFSAEIYWHANFTTVSLVRINCEKILFARCWILDANIIFLFELFPIRIRTVSLIDKDNHAPILIQRTSRKFDDDRCQRPSESCTKRDQEDTKHDINDIPG